MVTLAAGEAISCQSGGLPRKCGVDKVDDRAVANVVA